MNETPDTLYVCYAIRGVRWPPSTTLTDLNPIFPWETQSLVYPVVVPDTAVAGTNEITWFATCGFDQQCTYRVIIPELIADPLVTASVHSAVVSWFVADSSADTADVERRDPSSSWESLGQVVGNVGGRMEFEDAGVTPGGTYEYRLALPVEDQQIYRGEVTAAIPDLISDARATADVGAITVEWTANGAAFSATVFRSASGGPWVSQGVVTTDGTMAMTFVDRAVVQGVTYRYRLEISIDSSTWVRGEVEVLAAIAVDALELAHGNGNPAHGSVLLVLTQGQGGRGRLEIYDVEGRHVDGQDLPVEPGRYVVSVNGGRPLDAGIYFARATRGGRSVNLRLAVVN